MCKFKTLGVSWPPKGWKFFKDIETSHGQSVTKNPSTAVVTGMSYAVEPVPVYQKNGRSIFVYALHIYGWEYNIYNESCEYPILSFVLKERPNASAPKYLYMSEIKTKGCELQITQRSAHRVYTAALFIMKQICAGNVPDVERILKLYKIHPIQRDLYGADNERHSSTFYGIVDRDEIIDESSEVI